MARVTTAKVATTKEAVVATKAAMVLWIAVHLITAITVDPTHVKTTATETTTTAIVIKPDVATVTVI